jgi:anti-sigma-K factor RskA
MAAPREHSPRFDELLPAYALGALEGEELRELEEHVAGGCPECRRQIDLWQGDLEELAASVEPITPSAETREGILRAAAGSAPRPVSFPVPAPAPKPAPIRTRTGPPRWLALAATVLLAVAVWGVWRQASLSGEAGRLRSERDDLARQVATLDRRLDETQADNRRLAQTLSLITAPGARAVQLAGLGPTPGAVGHAFVNPQAKKAVFYAFDLPAAAPGKTYELWWIAAGRPVPAGTFTVDGHGAARVEVDNVDPSGPIQAWAVTVEPAGGVPQPTGAMVLKG